MIANIFKSRLADNIDQPTFVKIILVLPKFLLVSYLYNFLCINILLKEKARSIFFLSTFNNTIIGINNK